MELAESKIQTQHTLTIDIGGSGVKIMVLNAVGDALTERDRLPTPIPATPAAILASIAELAKDKQFDRISVGFPGVVRQGVIATAANLDASWIGFNLAAALSEQLAKPVRVANDADLQGLGAILGQGVELVLTLGTGVGSALFVNGKLVPNLELGHHPFRKGQTYEEQLGRAALDEVGRKRWNRRLEKAIDLTQRIFNYDTLYLGGGNARKIELVAMPANCKIIPNIAGLLGGIALWRE